MDLRPYGEFSADIHRDVNLRRIPVNGTFELTNRCPLNCSHCYNNLPMNDLPARRAELNLDEYKAIMDELADLGCLWLLLTGGEILARRDFFELYEYAKRKGFLVTLFTNGILIDERVADRLAAMPPWSIEITLYGRTRETYEALTRIPGSFDRCMRGIELLQERGLPLKLKSVAVSVNKHEVFDMRAFAEERGLEFKFDSMINPRIDCSSAPLSVRLTPEDIVELDLRDPARIAEWRRLALECTAAPPATGEIAPLYDCGGGTNSFAVDPYGDVTICVLSHFDKFNLRQHSFKEAWDALGFVRRKPTTRPTKCTSCSLKTVCGMCAANGELENGDAETPVEYLCSVAHLRAAAFEIPIAPHGDCDHCDLHRDDLAASAALLKERVRDLPAVPSLEALPTSSCGSGGCSTCHTR